MEDKQKMNRNKWLKKLNKKFTLKRILVDEGKTLRPSDEELESKQFRKVPKSGLEHAASYKEILKEAEEEMKMALTRGDNIPYISFDGSGLVQMLEWWKYL